MSLVLQHLVRLLALVTLGAIVLPAHTDFWTGFLFYFALIVLAEMSARIVNSER